MISQRVSTLGRLFGEPKHSIFLFLIRISFSPNIPVALGVHVFCAASCCDYMLAASLIIPRINRLLGRALVADGLGHLVGIVSVLGLERLDERDVLGLGLLLGDALVDLPLPGVLLCLAL